MRKPQKKFVIEYALWFFSDTLGPYLSFYQKEYYTLLGAKWDRRIQKQYSLGGETILRRKEVVNGDSRA